MAQAGALGSTVARLNDVVCKALETPWSNQVKRTAAKGAYKLWDQFVDIYAEQRGGPAVWGGSDPLPAPQKLPTFPGE
jgi:hypothetical protein